MLEFKRIFAIGVLLEGVTAQCSSTAVKSIQLPNFGGSNQCVPSGYFQSMDYGQTNPDDLRSRCFAQCVSMGSRCAATVGQLWKAGDAPTNTGQCFYYSTVPAGPAYCGDAPTVIFGLTRDTAPACLSSSASAATAFCSSYLGIGAVTVYTTTIYPTISTTMFSTNILTGFVRSTSTISTATTTIATLSTTTSSTTISTLTITSTTESVATVTTDTATSSLTFTGIYKRALPPQCTTDRCPPENPQLVNRAVVPPPACIPSFEPPASLSAACACLKIASTTVSTASTAPTFTSTIVRPARGATTTTINTSTTAISTALSSTVVTTIVTVSSLTSTTTTFSTLSTTVSTPIAIAPPTKIFYIAYFNRAPGATVITSGAATPELCSVDCGNTPNCNGWGFFPDYNGCNMAINGAPHSDISSQCPAPGGRGYFHLQKQVSNTNGYRGGYGPCFAGEFVP